MESESCPWLHLRLCKPLTRMVFTLVLSCHGHIEKSGTKKKKKKRTNIYGNSSEQFVRSNKWSAYT